MRALGQHTFMSAKATTGIGRTLFTQDYDKIEFSLDTVALTDGTIKLQASDSDTIPDFTAAQTAANSWYYVQVVDEDTNSEIDGSTGISPAGAKHYKLRANINGAKWVNAIVSSITAGSYTLKGKGYINC